jgi:predicted AlkP superfamily pyrophosphatase or phosphodiesterase
MRRALLVAALIPGLALAKPPRLVLFVTVDAMGSDLFLRSRPHFRAGFAPLIAQGAFFPAVRYEYAEVVTSSGHATLATGANPWRHGVVGNHLINRFTGQQEAIFADSAHPVLEAPPSNDDVSPASLLAETIGDRLRLSTTGRAKVISLSAKARAAIAMGGKLGQAWWFSEAVGKFVTGTYYAKEFPAWVKAFNDKRVPDTYFGKDWTLSLPPKEYVGDDDRPFEEDWYALGRVFPHHVTGGLPGPGPQFYAALDASPGMNDILVQFAKAALDGEKLGKDDVPDVLAVSLSPIDRIYHLYGPYSWEMQDAMARLDRNIADLVAAADRAAGGRANLLIVISADHGGAAIPEEWAAQGMPAVRVNPAALQQGLNKELENRFGGSLVQGIEETDVYLNAKAIAEKKLDGAAVRRAAAQWLAAQPSIQLAVARDDLDSTAERTGLLRALRMGYYPERSGDVLMLMKPFHVLDEDTAGTNHGQPYAYDNQVPLLLAGHGVRPGIYPQEIRPVDVAPSVAALLEIGNPASAEGSARAEAILPLR